MTLRAIDVYEPAELPVPGDRPFQRAEARRCLGSDHHLRVALRRGLLVSPLPGVFYRADAEQDLALRLACLRLVVPRDAVVCDRTAGWLHGAPRILAPGDHLETPKVSIYLPETGRRLRNELVSSGSREFRPGDIDIVDGVLVTSPLRTACDLGRLLHRDQAMAALDAMLRTDAFSRARLLSEVARYRGFRGVRQLRELAPLADGRAESPGESILRLRWLDTPDLAPPELQFPVGPWFLDLALPDIRYGAEYDGEEFHGPEHAEGDRRRREAMRRMGWTIDVFGKHNIHGHDQDAEYLLREGIQQALQGRRTTWGG